MEDNDQLLSQGKLPGENEQGMAGGLSCSPGRPITGSTDLFTHAPHHAMTRSPDDPMASPDHPISFTRSADTSKCRECLAAMAHRLAQPMTALRGGMELALMGKRTVADYRAVIEQSMHLADDMAQLIISLRDLGESGAPGGTPRCVLLEQTTGEVLAEMEGLAQARELHLQFNAVGAAKVCVDAERLREALQSLLAWVIQNSAGSGTINLDLSASEGEAQLVLSPPRLDLQYLQIKVLEDITNPGLLFSRAAKNGALGWAINQRLLDGLGGRLEILSSGQNAGSIRVRFPLAHDVEVGNPS